VHLLLSPICKPSNIFCDVLKVEYSRKEIRELLLMIDVGNRPRWSAKGPIGLKRTVSAFGIVGMSSLYCIRFFVVNSVCFI